MKTMNSVTKMLLGIAASAATMGMSAAGATAPRPAFDLVFDELNAAGAVADHSGNGRDGVLKGGAKIVSTERGPCLELDGKTGCVLVKNSAELHPENGFTLVITLHPDAFPRQLESLYQQTAQNLDGFLFKSKDVLLGRNGTGYTSTEINPYNPWESETRGLALAEAWQQVACVYQLGNSPDSGKPGFRRSLYLNGKLSGEWFSEGKPERGSNSWLVGAGVAGDAEAGKDNKWCFGGRIGRARVFETALTPQQIAALAMDDAYLDVLLKPQAAGGTVDARVSQRLDALEANVRAMTGQSGAEAAWLTSALRKLGGYAPPADLFSAEVERAETVLASGTGFSPEAWNAQSTLLKIFATERLGAAVRVDPGNSKCSLFGLYDLGARREVLGNQQALWQLDFSAAAKQPALRLDDMNAAVTSRVEPLGRNSFRIVWTTRGAAPKLTARSTFALKGARIEADFALDNASPALLDEVTFPVYRLAKLPGAADYVAYPHNGHGVEYKDPVTRTFGFEGLYPGAFAFMPRSCSMQFGAYYNRNEGVYFASEDPQARSKHMGIHGIAGELEVTCRWWVGCPGLKGGNSFAASGPGALELYRGDWFEAGQIYKNWLAAKAPWWPGPKPRADWPAWYRDLCVSAKTDTREADFLVRQSAKLRNYFGVPLNVRAYDTDHTFNDIFPNYKPVDSGFETVARTLRAKGVYLSPYTDARLWSLTRTETTWHGIPYIQAAPWECKDPDGKPYVEDWSQIYGGGKGDVVMCPATGFWKDFVLKKMYEQYARWGFSMYNDQVSASWPQRCYATNHSHVPASGEAWLQDGYWPMLKAARDAARKIDPEFIVFSENNAEPYAGVLDGFLGDIFCLHSGAIPLFASIYGGRVQLDGRSPNNAWGLAVNKTNLARELVWGETIGAFNLNNLNGEIFSDLARFAKKLVTWRYALIPWITEGEVARPVSFVNGDGARIDAPFGLENAVWVHGQTAALVFANGSGKKVAVKVRFDGAAYGIKENGVAMSVYGGSGDTPSVDLPATFEHPLTVEADGVLVCLVTWGDSSQTETLRKRLVDRFLRFLSGKAPVSQAETLRKRLVEASAKARVAETEDLTPYNLGIIRKYSPAPFTPDPAAASVPNQGLRLWLRSDAIGAQDQDATGHVGAWRDLSGNGYDAMATGEARPVLDPSATFQGLPALRFDGKMNAMEGGKGLGLPLPGPFTVVVVMNPRRIVWPQGIFCLRPNDGQPDYRSLGAWRLECGNNSQLNFGAGALSSTWTVTGDFPAVRPGRPLIATAVRSGRAGEAFRLFADGALISEEDCELSTPADAPRHSAGYRLADRFPPSGSGKENLHGEVDFYEVLVWDRPLTDAELKALHSYLLLPRKPLEAAREVVPSARQ